MKWFMILYIVICVLLVIGVPLVVILGFKDGIPNNPLKYVLGIGFPFLFFFSIVTKFYLIKNEDSKK